MPLDAGDAAVNSGTPNLENLWLAYIPEWPAGFSFANLPPTLKHLSIRVDGAAVCQRFNRATVEDVFGALRDRWDDIGLDLTVYIPPTITNAPVLAASSLGVALGLDPGMLTERWGRIRAGEGEWDSYTVEEKRHYLGSHGVENIFAAWFRIEISEFYDCGAN